LMCKLRQRQPRAAISGYTRRLRTQDRAISKPGSLAFPTRRHGAVMPTARDRAQLE